MKEHLPWKLEIEKADNGYEVKWMEEIDEATYRTHKAVFQVNESEEFGEQTAFIELLYFIKDHFGEYGNKYDKYRVAIQFEHGRSYECKDKRCTICKGEK